MSRRRWPSWLSGTPVMALVYALIAVVMTWPVARDLDTRLVPDLVDPAFNAWVLAWTTGHVLEAVRGDPSAFARMWDANIFHPEPMTLAYSEHLFGQALQALPIYAATGNMLVTYNAMLIATFALSGLAVYLLVRDLTGHSAAAFLAGIAFAYAPYRMGQLAHLQTLSSYWMPLALLGFYRYFARVTAGAPAAAAGRALAGGAAATAMQNLSCGYFALFFAPFAAAYCLYEMVQRRLTGRWRVWLHLAVAAAAVALVTWPFARAYMQLRELHGLGVRSLSSILAFSADTYAFATAAPTRVLGPLLPGFSNPEGTGFPGFTILAFAAIGLVWGLRRSLASIPWASVRDAHTVALALSGIVAVAASIALVWFFVYGSMAIPLGARPIRYRDATPALAVAIGSFAAFAVLGALARRTRAAVVSGTAFGFFAVAAVAAALLALGPEMHASGRRIGSGPYLWLLTYMPGVDGLRVPARMLMLVTLFLSVLVGFGAAALLATRARRAAGTLVVLGVAAVLAESWIAPVPTDLSVGLRSSLTPPPPPSAGTRINPIYEIVRALPDPVVLIELPFGDHAYDALAVFHAGHHRRPLVNGYSGFFPPSQRRNVRMLRNVLTNPTRAADALRATGATHVFVREQAFRFDHGPEVSEWLVKNGARLVVSNGADRLFVLP